MRMEGAAAGQVGVGNEAQQIATRKCRNPQTPD